MSNTRKNDEDILLKMPPTVNEFTTQLEDIFCVPFFHGSQVHIILNSVMVFGLLFILNSKWTVKHFPKYQ